METLNVANEIRNQIGNRALFMIGAKNLAGTSNSLSFKIGRNSKSVTHIKIELTAMDDYTVSFFRIRGTSFNTISVHKGIYVDMLHGLIESETGMYTSL